SATPSGTVACTKTWVSGSTWSTATWNPAGAPGANDDVCVAGPVTIDTPIPINSLRGGGSVTVAAPGSLTTFAPSDITTLTISGGAVTANSSFNVTTLNFSSGTLTGTGTVTMTGPSSTWTGGTMAGTGTTTITGTLNLSSFSSLILATRTLNNNGMVNWSGTGDLS